METLVFQSTKGKDVTTSLKVAEKFGKEHKHVLRDIEFLECSPEFNLSNFGLIEYTDSRNRKQKAYEITKDGFSFLVMGYTGSKAAEFKEVFISQFNSREALLKNDDFILSRALTILQDRTKLLESQVNLKTEQLQLANETIKEQAPMVAYYNDVLSADNSHLATAMAQMFNLGATTFNRLLRQWGIIRPVGGEWVLCAKYLGKGYTVTHPVPYLDRKNNVTKTKNELRWTEKSRPFLIDEFGKRGYQVKAVA